MIYRVNIQELLSYQNKGISHNLTHDEYDMYQFKLHCLHYVDYITDMTNNRKTLSDEQYEFIVRVLPHLINVQEPKLIDICSIYDIQKQDILSGIVEFEILPNHSFIL